MSGTVVDWMRPPEASEYTRLAESTLAKKRHFGCAPPTTSAAARFSTIGPTSTPGCAMEPAAQHRNIRPNPQSPIQPTPKSPRMRRASLA